MTTTTIPRNLILASYASRAPLHMVILSAPADEGDAVQAVCGEGGPIWLSYAGHVLPTVPDAKICVECRGYWTEGEQE